MGRRHFFGPNITPLNNRRDRRAKSKDCGQGKSCTWSLRWPTCKDTVYYISHRRWYVFPCSLSRYNFTHTHIPHPSIDPLPQPGSLLIPSIFLYLIESSYHQWYSIQGNYSRREITWSFNLNKYEYTLHLVRMRKSWKKSTQPDVCPRVFGKHTYAPENAIVIRPHWKYNINPNGTWRSREWCDVPKRSSPMLK